MKNDVVILMAEDDDGHAELIRRHLVRGGVRNDIVRFNDGQKVADFVFRRGAGPYRRPGASYVLLLDLRLPRCDGSELLAQLKTDAELRKLPVIVLSTTDDPREIDHCHALGCNGYLTKPFDPDAFGRVVRQLAGYLEVVEIPTLDGGGLA